MPTDAYSLDEAVADGHLVPPQAISVPLKIVRSGRASVFRVLKADRDTAVIVGAQTVSDGRSGTA